MSKVVASFSLALSVCVGACSIGFMPAAMAQLESDASDSLGQSLTIYNQNFGVVKDDRKFVLKAGTNIVRFSDVAAQIDPTTVALQSLSAPNSITVREQNYQYDLIDPTSILAKSIGKTLKFRQVFDNGTTRDFTGVLMNSPEAVIADGNNGGNVTKYSGLVIRTADGIVLNPVGQIEIAELPTGLISKPTLVWRLETNKPGDNTVEVAYQTQGMNWKADYVAVLNKDDTQLETLNSWVTLDNKSGATYNNAALKLMAGDVHRVQPPRFVPMMAKAAMAEDSMAGGAPQFAEAAFAEYHMYTLQGKTTVRNNETKQMSLFTADKIPANKLFIFEPNGSDSKKVNVKIEVENAQKNNMGMPLPGGTVRIYKKDADGAMQFIGEDHIDHTPKDEKVRLYIGDAFDVVGERTVMNTDIPARRVRREQIKIDLRNHKDVAVTVVAIEHPYGDWEIIHPSTPFTKKSSTAVEFPVKVPANGAVTINYEIDYHY
jgi:hypothetical protein